MKCVITGSNGFIGTMLKEKLRAKGAEVRCLVRSSRGVTEENGIKKYAINYADLDSIISSGALDDAEYIFHVAGVTKALSLDTFRKGNVVPTKHLIEAAISLKSPLKRFVLISSQAAAGPATSDTSPVTEAEPPNPIEDYGLSKLEAELLLHDAKHPFDHTIIRPSAVYGPRDVDFLALFKQLKSGLGIYPGNKDSYVSAIYVEDLVQGILDAATAERSKNQTYFLTREISLTWRQIYKIISMIWERKLLEINLPFGLVALAGNLGDVYSKITGQITVMNSKKIDLARPKYWVCSAEKAMKDFGFEPKTPIEDGLKQTFDWYKQAGWL